MVHSLAIVMTNKCNAACEMCCFSCSPEKDVLLDETTVKDFIRQASELDIKTVGFTGGEVMLFFDQLVNCVAYAESLGIVTTISTNGFWAYSVKEGYNMIKTLVDVGLKGVSFSVDKYHQAYVSYETVAQAIQICEQLGVLRTVSLIDTNDNHSVQEAIDRLALNNRNYKVHPLLPAGRAAMAIPDDQIIRGCAAEEAICPFNKAISLLFDGTISLCCSQFSHAIEMTKLGKLGTDSLADALRTFQNNDFFYILIKRRFKWYIDLATAYGLTIRKKYSSSCELCHELFSSEGFTDYISPFVQQEAMKLRMEKLFT